MAILSADMNSDQKPIAKNGLGDNLPYRISGLEKAKADPGMSPADIAALDRAITKLKQKLTEQNAPKSEEV